MNAMTPGNDVAPARAPGRRRWWWIGLVAALCLLAWIALGIGIALNVGKGATLILATLAAVSTEGVFWVTALVFGMSVYQARRRLWEKLRSRLR